MKDSYFQIFTLETYRQGSQNYKTKVLRVKKKIKWTLSTYLKHILHNHHHSHLWVEFLHILVDHLGYNSVTHELLLGHTHQIPSLLHNMSSESQVLSNLCACMHVPSDMHKALLLWGNPICLLYITLSTDHSNAQQHLD